MSRTLLIGLTLFTILYASRADDTPPVSILVVAADGTPAAKTKVWVYEYTGSEKAQPEPKPLVTDASGKVSVSGETARWSRQLFARDDAGRMGWAWLSTPWDAGDSRGELKVVLVDTIARAGRVTDADGKPVAGAAVMPTGYYTEERRRSIGGPALSIGIPEWEQARLVAATDAQGRFKLPAPADYAVSYRVKADGQSETRWTAPAALELETKLFVPGIVVVKATGVDPAPLKAKWVALVARSARAGPPGVSPIRYSTGTFDSEGKSVISDVIPGVYELSVESDGRIPGVLEKGQSFDVTAGKTTTVTAKFLSAAKVSGKITDKTTGKGIAGVQVFVRVSDGMDPYPKEQYHVNTDTDGKFVAHGSAGWYSAWVQRAPDGHATPPPAGRRGEQVKPAKVEVGAAHTFEAIELPKSVTLSGQVVFVDGKPATGATVHIHSDWSTADRSGRVTDRDGHFTIKNIPPDDAVQPRVRRGNAVNVPMTFELEKTIAPVVIEVSEKSAAGFKGRVIDARGRPLAGANVSLRQHLQLVGRQAQYSTVRPLDHATTDAEGRYSFSGLWPRDGYHVHVTADGYAEAEGKQLEGTAGEVKEFAEVRLTRASLSVAGVVVGRDGKPVAGAEVFGVDGPSRFSTSSGADGTFTLTGYYEGAGFVFAKKAGHRFAAVAVVPGGSERVAITLSRTDDPPNPAPEVTVEHRAGVEKFTRHALKLIWENHDVFGYGGNALEDMARIDLDTAKMWRDDAKKRTGGKTDFTYLVDRVVREKTLFDTAKADIDEALAILSALKPSDGFTEAVRLGERFLVVDRAKAARLAEEAVVRARQLEFPAKVWSLAEAGDLAARAGMGERAGGKKVLLEAADLAAKLTPDENSRNSMAVGMVAARLAAHDWPRAEALLNSLKDPGDFNRYLAATVGRLAGTDFPKAKELLTHFKPSNSSYPQTGLLRVAFAVARTQPDEAVKLVDSVEKGPYRFQGYVRLSVLLAPTDKARAVKLIETAFDLLDREPEAFRSWSGYGGRAGVAVVGLVRAKEIGYPDLAGLVARTLALRPTAEDDWSPGERDTNRVKIASALALVDPAAARQMLAGIATPDEFVEQALGQRREWLFALALADPAHAVKLADKLIERAKTKREGGRNPLSETGLLETCTILTSPDRLRDLTSYSSLPREIGDED